MSDKDIHTAPTLPNQPKPVVRGPVTNIEIMQELVAMRSEQAKRDIGLAREFRHLGNEVTALREEQHALTERVVVLEKHIAPSATRPRLPSLGDVADARELAQLDASQGGPPSIVDQLTRLNDSEIRTRKLAHKGPIYSAAFVSIAIALADIIKAYLLHR